MRPANRVLLVCWEGADWRMIHPLLDAGQMPHLSAIVDAGVMGELATLQPQLAPLLSASLATGTRADRHGVLSYLKPHREGVRPVARYDRGSRAMWSILNEAGLRTHVVGWPGYPAEAVDGIATSHLFTRHGSDASRPLYERLPRAVHPMRLAETLAELRVDPTELSHHDLLPFVPRAAEVDQQRDPGLSIIATWLAESAGTHSIATWAIANEPWEFAAVHYDLIDRFSHAFMQFHPPRRPTVRAGYELYCDVMNEVYRHADRMLGRLLELAGPETTIIVMSEHGFRSGADRPQAVGRGRSDVGWHSVLGILAMRGRALRRDEWIWGATLLDICPTVLSLFGLPLPEALDGRPLLQAFDDEWLGRLVHPAEPASMADNRACTESCLSDDESAAVLQHMLDENYLEREHIDGPRAAGDAIDSADFNLAQVCLEQNRLRDAEELLQRLVDRRPEVARYVLQLAQCKLGLDDLEGCRQLVELAIARGLPRPHGRKILAQLLTRQAKYDEALAELFEVEQLGPRQPGIHWQIGDVYVAMERWDDARRAFHKELDLNADNAHAYLGLGQVALAEGDYDDAIEKLLSAVSLWKWQPKAHFLLATTLERVGKPADAIRAFERSLELDPTHKETHGRLADLYDRIDGQQALAQRHRQLADS